MGGDQDHFRGVTKLVVVEAVSRRLRHEDVSNPVRRSRSRDCERPTKIVWVCPVIVQLRESRSEV
jgi:hypothetical protein